MRQFGIFRRLEFRAHRSSSHVRLVESLLKSSTRNYARPRTNLSRSIRSAWGSSLIESNRSNRRSCVHSLHRAKQPPESRLSFYQRVHVFLASIIPLSREEISNSEKCGSTRRGLLLSLHFPNLRVASSYARDLLLRSQSPATISIIFRDPHACTYVRACCLSSLAFTFAHSSFEEKSKQGSNYERKNE